jgi:hypothetical protein
MESKVGDWQLIAALRIVYDEADLTPTVHP